MDRKRIFDEVIEILSNKLHQLPPPSHGSAGVQEEDAFDYESCKLVPDITSNHLDIAEVTMDMEDAFGVSFEDSKQPGAEGLETIGKVVDFITARVNRARQPVV